MTMMERKRPFLATVICVVTALYLAYRLFLMLPGHQPALSPQMAEFQNHAQMFSVAMMWIEIVLSAGGIIALWLMRPVAAAIYAAKIATTVVDVAIGIFAFHLVHAEQARLANPSNPLDHTMPVWATWALPIMAIVFLVSFQVLLFLYVRRVTSPPPGLRDNRPEYT
jgi:small-conductance mechanosensitive channel